MIGDVYGQLDPCSKEFQECQVSDSDPDIIQKKLGLKDPNPKDEKANKAAMPAVEGLLHFIDKLSACRRRDLDQYQIPYYAPPQQWIVDPYGPQWINPVSYVRGQLPPPVQWVAP